MSRADRAQSYGRDRFSLVDYLARCTCSQSTIERPSRPVAVLLNPPASMLGRREESSSCLMITDK